jgi:hypothetical protein
VLSGWWAVNWSPARSHVVSASGGWMDRDSHGERKNDGVHVWFAAEGRRYHGPPASLHEHNFEARVRRPDVVMPWSEVREIVMAGASIDRRVRYDKAYGAYCEHATSPLPHPPLRPGQRRELGLPEHDDRAPHPENEAFWEEGLRIHRELNEAGYDILQAGVGLVVAKEEAEPVQGLLW